MEVMETREKAFGGLDRDSLTSKINDSVSSNPIVENQPENQAALAQLVKARQRLYAAAIAYCEGHISAGQLRAIRELLRAHEQQLAERGEVVLPPFIEDLAHVPETAERGSTDASAGTQPPPPEEAEMVGNVRYRAAEHRTPVIKVYDPDQTMQQKLDTLERKINRLEEDIREGRINSSQYRAIYRHYEEQRTVAVRLHERHPGSEQWRVVLEDGKTNFLMQVHEAVCYGAAFYDYRSQELLYLEGKLPGQAREGIAFLGAFGGPVVGDQSERMFATQSDDGTTLLLIPGRFSAALVAFSKEPPEWQARALREVHRNFECGNRAVFEQGLTRSLVFPNLSNFIRT